MLVALLLTIPMLPQDPSAAGLSVGIEDLSAPVLRLDRIPELRERILPDPEELVWEEIPWLTSFAEGVRAADRAGKPLLFWAMNGHPLGCT